MGVVEHPFGMTERGSATIAAGCAVSSTTTAFAGGGKQQVPKRGHREGTQRVVATDEPLPHLESRTPPRDAMPPSGSYNGPVSNSFASDATDLVTFRCDSPVTRQFLPGIPAGGAEPLTADWHTRYNAVCSVYGHQHTPAPPGGAVRGGRGAGAKPYSWL